MDGWGKGGGAEKIISYPGRLAVFVSMGMGGAELSGPEALAIEATRREDREKRRQQREETAAAAATRTTGLVLRREPASMASRVERLKRDTGHGEAKGTRSLRILDILKEPGRQRQVLFARAVVTDTAGDDKPEGPGQDVVSKNRPQVGHGSLMPGIVAHHTVSIRPVGPLGVHGEGRRLSMADEQRVLLARRVHTGQTSPLLPDGGGEDQDQHVGETGGDEDVGPGVCLPLPNGQRPS